MLRNMVSSLLQHEQIKTTVPKAKEASRVAEWIITMGKKGTLAERRRAESYLMNPDRTVPKLFYELSHRYADRHGGYTRIHRFGHRKGDHAPHAILELVDNPNDLKFGMTAKAVGRELAKLALTATARNGRPRPEVTSWAASASAFASATDAASTSSAAAAPANIASLPPVYKLLRPNTQESLLKVIRHRQIGSSAPAPAASSSTSSTTSPAPPPPPTPSAFAVFEQMAREAFYRTTAVGKVPAWQVDEGKAASIDAMTPKFDDGDEAGSVLTLPGHGRKLWAGQEDQASGAWEDVVDEDVHAEAEQELLRELKHERLARLQKKLRHPDGRNGNGNASGVNRQRSALSRAQGHRAAPRTLAERRQRLDMPTV